MEKKFPWMIIRACSKKTFMFSILWHLKRIFNREHESGWLVCAEQNHWEWPLKNSMNCTLAHGQSVDPERMCLWVQCSELKCYHKRVFLPAHFTALLLSYKYVWAHAVHSIVQLFHWQPSVILLAVFRLNILAHFIKVCLNAIRRLHRWLFFLTGQDVDHVDIFYHLHRLQRTVALL